MQKFSLLIPTVERPTLLLYKRLFLTAGGAQLRHLLHTPVPAQQALCMRCLYKGWNTGMRKRPLDDPVTS